MSEKFGNRQKQSAVVLILMLAGIAYMSWVQEDLSPESQVRQIVQVLIAAGEAGNVAPFRKHLSEQVEDHEGRDKQQIVQILRALFFRYKNIQLQELGLDVAGGTNPDVITARLSMLMGNETFVPTEKGNFILTFRREGDVWRIWQIDWKDATKYH